MRVILDTDLSLGAPGSEIDDGFALALLLSDPVFDLELVTTVNGNIDVESATLLSLDLLRRLGRPDIPVVRGAAAPLLNPERSPGAPAHVRAPLELLHTGRDDVRAALAHLHLHPHPGYAAAELASRVAAAPGEITVVAIGPLTNIAAAIALDDRFAGAVKEIVVMGGYFLGQMNRQRMPGEFNWWIDPDAAGVVLRSGAPLRLVGLDVTLRVRVTRDDAARMSSGAGDFGRFAGACVTAWLDRMADARPSDPEAGRWSGLHDPLAVAAVSRPDLVTFTPAHVEVIRDDPGRGIAVADLLESAHAPVPNALIATDVDVDGFRSYLLDRIGAL